MRLFRPEALRGQDRLHGDVVLVPPVSWQLLSGFLLLTILIAVAFLATATFAKTTTVSGRLTGDRGILRVVPTRAGLVEAILVREGQQVVAGTPLVRISIRTADGASSLESRRARAVAERESILAGRAPDIARAARARVDSLRAGIEGDRRAVASISSQIAEQRALVASAVTELERARTVAARGYLSGRDILQREELLATRRQGLSRLEEELGNREARIASAAAELQRARSELELQLADVAGERAALSGLAAADENASTIIVTAAEAGVVTGIVAHAGDRASPETPILSIVPAGTKLQARMEVPPAAAGFLKAGQEIRLAVDSFPYQTFGTVPATVGAVSLATVPLTRPDGSTGEAFLVEAALAADALDAFGERQPLRPGMTVSARITTRSRSLAEWLFEPLFAVGRR